MAQWYVKDLAKLTEVSVQTLHHYDRIGLLNPSVRLPNGYRLYSEKDLLKLQQIIALKYFGFELTQIKTLLMGEADIIDHFSIQLQFLNEKAQTLLQASNTLQKVIAKCDANKSISWETIIKLIEVFRMTQQLENKWVEKILTPEELKAYVKFEQSLKKRYTESSKASWEKEWFEIVTQVNSNLKKDPRSELGMKIGKQCMDLVNKLYGKEYVTLRMAIWEKGFKGGHATTDYHGLSPQAIDWLDQSMKAYYYNQIYIILNQVSQKPHAVVLKKWNDLLSEMYGDEENPKSKLVQDALSDDNVNEVARDWLKKINNL
jgi:DNA-binding transcriptional MerR regulator